MNVTNGMTWKELAVIAAMVAGVGWGVSKLSGGSDQQISSQKESQQVEYQMMFYDADGNPIELERWPGSPTQ